MNAAVGRPEDATRGRTHIVDVGIARNARRGDDAIAEGTNVALTEGASRGRSRSAAAGRRRRSKAIKAAVSRFQIRRWDIAIVLFGGYHAWSGVDSKEYADPKRIGSQPF
jgi:hypothetical protein